MRLSLAAFCLTLLLTGCTVSSTAPLTPETGAAETGAAIQGNVRGGQQPIVGAHVYLYAANITGYGGNGIAASTANASLPLLTSSVLTNNPSNSGEDSNNNYFVTSDSNGNFTIGSDYTCASGQQVYLYTVGGNPGAGANSATGLLAVLGNCGSAGNFATATPFIWMNEVSTVAAAYAFAGFATDATHVSSSGTSLALTGIANAFANAANLETLSTGVALAATPSTNGSVPQTTIYTLANILAACINSTGPGSSGCGTLLSDAESGGSTGTAPTDTATAAINIAHNPGANITPLYGLSTPNAAFAGGLTVQPNDFTIGINYTGGGLDFPTAIAIDASGNAWVAGGYSSIPDVVTEISSTGYYVSGSNGYVAVGGGGTLTSANSIAIDTSGNAWIAYELGSNNDYGGVGEINSSGHAVGNSPFLYNYPNNTSPTSASRPWYIAIDGSGDVWTVNETYNFTELSSSGTFITGSDPHNSYWDDPRGLAIDGSGNAWTPQAEASTVLVITSAGTVVTPSYGYAYDLANPLCGICYGGMDYPWFIAMDSSGNAWIENSSTVTELTNGGAGNVWVANGGDPGSIAEISNSGSPISGSTGYGYRTSGNLNGASGIAIDGSGDVWTANYNGTNPSVTELIGVAAPVITPICAGLPSTPTGNGSSKLGTRP